MALTATQIANLLFKKLLGKGSSNDSRQFFEEPYNGRPSVLPSQVWNQAEDIPNTAPGSTAGVVELFTDEPLTAIAGTTNSFYSANLVDAIPFNFGDGTSYNYSLKDSLGNAIAFGQGDWVVDGDAGVLTFYGTVPANMPPTITFYKYVGTKGVGSGSGGGGGSLVWNEEENSAYPEFRDGVLLYSFSRSGGEQLSTVIQVPASYRAGTQIKMTLPILSIDSSGTMELSVETALIKPTVSLLSTVSFAHANTPTAIALTGSNVDRPYRQEFLLTDASGLIGGSAVAPGDIIKVRLYRAGGTSTRRVYAMVHSAEVSFT